MLGRLLASNAIKSCFRTLAVILFHVGFCSLTLPLEQFQGSNVVTDDDPVSSFQGRSSREAFLVQAVDDEMSLALCFQVMSQLNFSTLPT